MREWSDQMRENFLEAACHQAYEMLHTAADFVPPPRRKPFLGMRALVKDEDLYDAGEAMSYTALLVSREPVPTIEKIYDLTAHFKNENKRKHVIAAFEKVFALPELTNA